MSGDQAKTGWPPGMLQDDDRGFSRWLASKPDALRLALEAYEAWAKEQARKEAVLIHRKDQP